MKLNNVNKICIKKLVKKDENLNNEIEKMINEIK